MPAEHELLLPEVLEFRRGEGSILLHDQRVVIVGATALGWLRRELVDALGFEAARRLLRRFGFAHGYQDAMSLRAQRGCKDPVEGARLGSMLHALEGAAHVELVRLEADRATGRFDAEAHWHQSYEAEQHLYHFGPARAPACWTLAGYASGYVSACLGGEVYFRETACAAISGAHCTVVGRDVAGWQEEGEALRAEYGGPDLAQAMETVAVALRRQRETTSPRARGHAGQQRELEALRERVAQYARSAGVVAVSPAFCGTLELSARVAPLETAVLICGESGTGKELVVRMIHELSQRATQPLVCVNCAALTDTLLESELFGHVRGAFTDAVRDKPGLFEIASGGTLFLDEVEEMSPALQAKLLRALQDREIRRVGGEASIRVNPRVIAAANLDLRAAVHAGRFREDLYYRLAAFTITVPPLRERREAIPALADEFRRRAAQRFQKDVESIAPDAIARLLAYPWPGNVRELQHAIDRAVILAAGPRLTAQDLPPELQIEGGGTPGGDTFDLRQRERETIEQALAQFGGNRRRAAAALKISTTTLWRRIRQYGVRVPAGPR